MTTERQLWRCWPQRGHWLWDHQAVLSLWLGHSAIRSTSGTGKEVARLTTVECLMEEEGEQRQRVQGESCCSVYEGVSLGGKKGLGTECCQLVPVSLQSSGFKWRLENILVTELVRSVPGATWATPHKEACSDEVICALHHGKLSK